MADAKQDKRQADAKPVVTVNDVKQMLRDQNRKLGDYTGDPDPQLLQAPGPTGKGTLADAFAAEPTPAEPKAEPDAGQGEDAPSAAKSTSKKK